MATLTIRKSDIEDGRLPLVCAVCGVEADHTRTVNFIWTPGWIIFLWGFGLLPAILGYLLARKTMTVPLPVCGRHQGYWSPRLVILWGGVVVAIAISCLGGYVESYWDREIGDNILMSGVGLLVLTGLAAFLFGDTGVSADKITTDAITLKGVSDHFVQAMGQNQERRAPVQGVALQTAKYFQAGYGRGEGY
jgi:hypothetical protein